MGDRLGLAAEELATETLFPGDTVEYFSMVRCCLCAHWLGWYFPALAHAAARARAMGIHPWLTRLLCLQAFVAGDPRGHRVAKILRVTPSDDEYPLRLDSQEM